MERTNFLSYLGVLQELAATLEELTSVQQEKTQVVRADDLAGLNECMKREQALSLALRSLDQRRETALAAMGLREVPLSGLTAQAPEDCREETRRTVELLRDQYLQYHGAAEVARNTLECNLHQIEKVLAEMNPEGQTGAVEPQLPSQMRTDFRA